jgi:hypothetical protein
MVCWIGYEGDGLGFFKVLLRYSLTECEKEPKSEQTITR